MQDNWYEAVISRQAPHRILSVVDWASDAPISPEPPVHPKYPVPPEPPVPPKNPVLPEPPVSSEPAQRPPATYHVFEWGINDPSEGNRSLTKENFDTLASPLGWHVIPVANDPSLSSDLKKKGKYSNHTITFGNNVSTSVVVL
jgi:extracellular elastinolytic metalloproteinase